MLIIIGFFLIVFAVFLLYNIKKKDFEGTNQYGGREYSSYNSYIASKAGNGVVKFFGIILVILGVTSITWGLWDPSRFSFKKENVVFYKHIEVIKEAHLHLTPKGKEAMKLKPGDLLRLIDETSGPVEVINSVSVKWYKVRSGISTSDVWIRSDMVKEYGVAK